MFLPLCTYLSTYVSIYIFTENFILYIFNILWESLLPYIAVSNFSRPSNFVWSNVSNYHTDTDPYLRILKKEEVWMFPCFPCHSLYQFGTVPVQFDTWYLKKKVFLILVINFYFMYLFTFRHTYGTYVSRDQYQYSCTRKNQNQKRE